MNPNATPPVALVLAARNLARAVRTPMMVTASLAQPVIWLVLFSQIFRGLAGTPEFRSLGYRSYVDFFAPAMLVLSMLFTAMQSGMATVTDIDTGMMDKLLASPIRRSAILAGRVIADAVTMTAQGLLLLAAGFLLGARFHTGWAGAAVTLGFAVAFGVAWAGLSNMIALKSRNSELTMLTGMFVTLTALFLSSAFFPRPYLPGWLQAVTNVNPAAYVISIGQQLMNAGNSVGQDLRTLAAVAATALVLLPACAAAFRAAARH